MPGHAISAWPSIFPKSVNEYQFWLGRERQAWFIPFVDKYIATLERSQELNINTSIYQDDFATNSTFIVILVILHVT